MADLYKGQAGSPITYLTSDITAGQTTISVADDSALPDAPNIATIGFGENLETIKYESKNNGVLQNVTRGIEGTPQAWPAGTEVARFYTAFDHNNIVDTLNGLGRIAKEDYEEGTWTPTLTGTNTYTLQTGVYTRSGNIVIAKFGIELSAKNMTAGNIYIGNLPFTPKNDSGGFGGFVTRSRDISFLSGTSQINIYKIPNYGLMSIASFGSSSSGSYALTDANFKNTSRIEGVLIYDI